MKDNLDLAKLKETITQPLRKATLCFLIKDNQILLAMKKRGFATGKWNAPERRHETHALPRWWYRGPWRCLGASRLASIYRP